MWDDIPERDPEPPDDNAWRRWREREDGYEQADIDHAEREPRD